MTKKEYIALYNDHFYARVGFLAKSGLPRADAEDVVQDVFMAMWRLRKRIRYAEAKSYLFVATKNKRGKLIKKKIVRQKFIELLRQTISQRAKDLLGIFL